MVRRLLKGTAGMMHIAWMSPLVLSVLCAQTSTPHADLGPRFDAHRLQLGTFRYSDSVGGKNAGESRIKIQRSPDGQKYVFSNVVDGSSDQSWKAVISSNFAPISAELTFGGSEGSHKAFDLSYSGNRVFGTATVRQSGGTVVRRVAEDLALDTVDQRIDWAAVMSLRSYEKGQKFTFHVYDPKEGNSPVTATVEGTEKIHTGAGSFRVVHITYRIEKTRGPQTFSVFVNDRIPRFLVKEVFPWGMSSELMEETPD
jgi:hypothetical protein